jgi:transposase
MTNLTEAFYKIEIDWALWEKFYHKNQKAYIRKRLNAIKLLWKGQSRYSICVENLRYGVLTTWIKMYLSSNIDERHLPKNIKKEELSPTYKALHNLCQPITRKPTKFLTSEQEQALKAVIISKKPEEVGLAGYIWTGVIIAQYIKREFKVIYQPTSVYDVLARLGLSHQRAHQDYANADKQEQAVFVSKVKKKSPVLKRRKSYFLMNFVCMTSRPHFTHGAKKISNPMSVVTKVRDAHA